MLEMMLSAWTMNDADVVGRGFNATQEVVALSTSAPASAWVTSDPPYLAEPQQQVVILAQASKTEQAKPKKEYVMGMCQGAYRRTSAQYGSYNSTGVSYFLGGMGKAKQYWGLRDIPKFIKPEHIQVLHSPKHGKLVYEAFPQNSNPGSDYGDYLYTPDIGYVGNDKMTFKLDVNGKIFKIVYVVKVVHERNVTNDDPSAYCPEPETWKISSTSPDGTQIVGWGFNPTQAMVALPTSASAWVTSDPPYQFLVNTPW